MSRPFFALDIMIRVHYTNVLGYKFTFIYHALYDDILINYKYIRGNITS